MLIKPTSTDYKDHHDRWYPYVNHGGSIIAIAGDNFSVLGTDMRLSEDASGEIMSRHQSKAYKLTPTTMLGLCGFHGDVNYLLGQLEYSIKIYTRENYTTISTPALASMLACTLYNRRFFPLYVYNLLVGLDDEGKGCMFSFDPVGSYERESYKAGGSAAAMLQPILDNQIGNKNQNNIIVKIPLTPERAVSVVRDSFISAAERDVLTGDGITIHIITKDGITTKTEILRGD
ncbi:unnamed protein product [Gordionus sp. m RMFG-2023]